MAKNPLDFPDRGRLDDLTLNMGRLFDIIPEGWVFAGVMRRADAPFYVGSENERYIAIATMEGTDSLGPIPEVRGSGRDMVAAIVDLRLAMQQEFGIEDEGSQFHPISLTGQEDAVESDA